MPLISFAMDPHTLVCLDTDRVREGVFGAEDLSDEALAMEHLLSLVTRKLMLALDEDD